MKEKNCPKCKTVKPYSEYYLTNDIPTTYCKPCLRNQAVFRQRLFKVKCMEYKGGKCESCGYNKCNNALEFHHKDRTEKEFSISHQKKTCFDGNFEYIKKELDKCELLCANCHREKEWELVKNKYGSDKDMWNEWLNTKAKKPPKYCKCGKRIAHRRIYCSKECRPAPKISYKPTEIKVITENTKYCSCGSPLNTGIKYCSYKCSFNSKRKVERPSLEQLNQDLSELPMTKVGKKYGVSDNTIRKWLKFYSK